MGQVFLNFGNSQMAVLDQFGLNFGQERKGCFEPVLIEFVGTEAVKINLREILPFDGSVHYTPTVQRHAQTSLCGIGEQGIG